MATCPDSRSPSDSGVGHSESLPDCDGVPDAPVPDTAATGTPATGTAAPDARVRKLRLMDDPEVLERVLAGLLNLR
jgi:hypothetical protein